MREMRISKCRVGFAALTMTIPHHTTEARDRAQHRGTAYNKTQQGSKGILIIYFSLLLFIDMTISLYLFNIEY
jgi:hypothetical protein